MKTVLLLFSLILAVSAFGQKPKKITVYYYKKLKSYEGYELNGEKTGTWTYWNNQGLIVRIENYKHGILDGKFTEYHDYSNIAFNAALPAKSLLKTYTKEQKKKVASGIKTDGNYVNGKKEGNWREYNNSGVLIKEASFLRDTLNGHAFVTMPVLGGSHTKTQEWKMGVLHGPYSETKPNYSSEGNYADGKKDGTWKETEGDKRIVENYKNGKLHGERLEFYQQKPLSAFHYKEGVKDGAFTEYAYHGVDADVTRITGNYVNGLKDGKITQFKNDKPEADWMITHGEVNGIQHTWYPNGKLKSIVLFRNKQNDSIATTWREDGTKLLEWYDKGVILKTRTISGEGVLLTEKFINDKKEEVETSYYANGKKSKETVCSQDPSQKCTVTTWNEKGVKQKTEALERELPPPPPDKEYDMLGVDQLPEFPGGEDALMNYLRKNVRYPQMAKEMNIQGKVFIGFVIDTDGKIINVEVLRSPDKTLSNEAVRVIKTMPLWKPGSLSGKPVKVKYTLPIHFVLQ